ncbi:hypothetical protein D3C84_1080970 [compost metagenome]
MQSTKHQIGNEVTEHVTHGHRGWVFRVEYAAFRCNHFKWCQGRRVVRDLRCDNALQAIAGVGLGVSQRHVDTELAHP